MSEKYQIHEATNGAWFVGKHNSGCAYSAKQIYDALDKVGRDYIEPPTVVINGDEDCKLCPQNVGGECKLGIQDFYKDPSSSCPDTGTYELVLRRKRGEPCKEQ